MDKSMEGAPLFGPGSALRGLISGSLLVGSVIAPYGIWLQALLFLFGLFVFLDAILPAGQGLYVFTVVLSMIFGGILSVVSMVLGFFSYYGSAMVIVAALVYMKRFMGK